MRTILLILLCTLMYPLAQADVEECHDPRHTKILNFWEYHRIKPADLDRYCIIMEDRKLSIDENSYACCTSDVKL